MNSPDRRAQTRRRRLGGALLLIALALLLYNALFSFSYSIGPNYRNVSIDTEVNITYAVPTITGVRIDTPVTLTAGDVKVVNCNVSVIDYSGYGFINFTNATFYHSTSSSGAADDNNTHYTNTSCAAVSQNGNYANFTCSFSVYYYALNGTWTCNATVQDNVSANVSLTNTSTVNALLALNVTPLINYGNLPVGGTSTNQTENVTNIGNNAINMSVKGWGNVPGDGLAFICAVGNITVGNERFSTSAAATYATMTPLTANFQNVTGLTIAKQNDVNLKINTTYWQLYVPPNPFGQCNGTIVFQAELS
jgi:hypothetical protein